MVWKSLSQGPWSLLDLILWARVPPNVSNHLGCLLKMQIPRLPFCKPISGGLEPGQEPIILTTVCGILTSSKFEKC